MPSMENGDLNDDNDDDELVSADELDERDHNNSTDVETSLVRRVKLVQATLVIGLQFHWRK